MDVLTLLIAWLLGLATLRALLAPRGLAQYVLAISLAWPVGAGLGSITYVALHAVGISSALAALLLEVAAGAALLFVAHRRRATTVIAAESVRPGAAAWVLTTAALAMLALIAAGLLGVSSELPHGDWDAWSIWNLRAKFLAGPGDAWKHAMSPLLANTHPEYPLLLSGLTASAWAASGNQTAGVPQAISFLYFFAGLGVLFGSLWIARGLVAASGMLVATLAAPVLLAQVPTQYADLPLAAYYVSACALAVFGLTSDRSAAALSLCGICAGMAAWTKNEGLLFAGVLGLALLAFSIWTRKWKSSILPFAAGVAPGIVVALVFKLLLAPPTRSGIVASDWAVKILDPSRWGRVLGAISMEIWNWNPGFTHPALIIAALLLACGLRWRREEVPAWLCACGTVLATLLGYAAVLTVAPDLEWEISTALPRLLVQLWLPAALSIGLLLGVPALEQVPARPPQRITKPSNRARSMA